jgi:hypothetical protein
MEYPYFPDALSDFVHTGLGVHLLSTQIYYYRSKLTVSKLIKLQIYQYVKSGIIFLIFN